MYFFPVPFAAIGDKTPIATTDQGEGVVSIPRGWGYDFERPLTDPDKENIKRGSMNQIINMITTDLGEIERCGYAPWSAVMAPYSINCRVRHNDKIWQSTINSNSAEPGVGTGGEWSDVTSSNIPSATTTVLGATRLATGAEVISGHPTAVVTADGALARYVPNSLQVTTASPNITIDLSVSEYFTVEIADNVPFTVTLVGQLGIGRTAFIYFDKTPISNAAPVVTFSTVSTSLMKPDGDTVELTAGKPADVIFCTAISQDVMVVNSRALVTF